jgi:hypothetical protein
MQTIHIYIYKVDAVLSIFPKQLTPKEVLLRRNQKTQIKVPKS